MTTTRSVDVTATTPQPRRLGHRLVAVALICSLLVPALPLRRAQAAHPCLIACGMTAPPVWALHESIVMGGLAAFDEWLWYLMSLLQSSLTKYANQGSNDEQNLVNSVSGLQDHVDTTGFANSMAEARIATAMEIRPSETGCAANQESNKLMGIMLGLNSGSASFLPDTGTTARQGMAQAESNTFNTTWSNAAGTAGEKGRLAYMNDRYNQRIARYNNNAATGLATAPSIAADADLTPLETIMAKQDLNNPDDLTAAQDVVFNLVGDAVDDPVRGQALIRSEGRGSAVLRNQQSARLNLSSTILQGMVERRRNNPTTGKSEQAFNAEAANYTSSATRALDIAKNNAEQGKSANLDTLVAMIGDASRQLFVMQTFMEQWAALKAVSLAIDVKTNSAGNAGVGVRTLSN